MTKSMSKVHSACLDRRQGTGRSRQDLSKEALITSKIPVIASAAKQSHAMESVGWRLLRHCVPRNDELIRGSLEVRTRLHQGDFMAVYCMCHAHPC